MTSDDLTARARLRDAAIALVSREGPDALTARRVAQEAGVSAGLVRHHFGSMDGLRRACDEHVASVIRRDKEAGLAAGPSVDPLAALRESGSIELIGYLAAVLTQDTPAVADLVDLLVRDAEAYLEQAESNGQVRPTPDPRRRAAITVLWSLGSLVLHRHAERLLGVDPVHPASADPDALAAYVIASTDLLGGGLFTPAFTESLMSQLTKAHA